MPALLIVCLLAACSSVPAPLPVVAATEPASCRQLSVAATAPDDRAVDLIVAINGDECLREPLWAGPVRFATTLTEECRRAIEPGENRVLVRLVTRQNTCGETVAEATRVCEGPEPD